jgi:predicted nucleotidyltransferase
MTNVDVNEEIDRLVSLIVAEVHPLRVVLFGSAARGSMTFDSDIDLLVVVPDGTHRLRTMQQLYGRIRGVALPFDLLVATASDIEARGDTPGLVYREALRDGKELYAA